MQVLVAEDEDTSRNILKTRLEKLGHEVIECTTGKDVLGHLFKGSLPQLLILDWMMPEKTGVEVCEEIRKRHDLCYTYIILLTSKSAASDIITGLRSGANDYMTKPVSVEDLHARLNVGIQMIELNNLVVKQRLKLIATAKMATLGEMASGMAHEINNPLTVILGYAERIYNALNSGEKLDVQTLQTSCSKIVATTQRIAKIVSALRSFAADGEKEPTQPTKVKTVINDALSFCELKLRANEVSVEIEPFPEELYFEGRGIQICQVLLNLLSNAFLAVKEIQKKWIKIEVSEDADNVLIAVSDSGPGISEEIRAKLMQPFFTTRPVGQGTGLGLSISKGIVETHKGQLWLDVSALHTRFVISLPKKRTDAKKAVA